MTTELINKLNEFALVAGSPQATQLIFETVDELERLREQVFKALNRLDDGLCIDDIVTRLRAMEGVQK
jgi:hypothetical protein